MRNIRNWKLEIGNPGEAGVTLLLALFIMSGLTLIIVTVSGLAIQSIRNSRSVALAEPAIGAAHSGAEEGVWGIKRAGTVPVCGSTTTQGSETLGNTSYYSARSFCKSYADATFELQPNTPFVFYLYNPEDAGDIDLSGMPDGGYHCMAVDMVSGTNNLNVRITRLNGTPVGNPPPIVTVSPSSSRVASSCAPGLWQRTITNLDGPSGADNRMEVTLTYWPGGSGTEPATVKVTTDQGMPSFPTIDSVGCAQRGAGASNQCDAAEIYSRKIQVTVPR